MIPPDKFISLAEENGFIIAIGEWVIQEVVKQIQKWEDTAYKDLKISLNVSAHQFKDMSFSKKVTALIKGVDCTMLDFEITESVFLNDSKKNIEIIEYIKNLGITFSLDDFGTGYSSLSYLRKIPIDTLKIDKSFIDAIDEETGKTFVELIVDIAKTLSLQIVAEGVETKKKLEYLRSIKCDLYQGYLCSKPLEVKEFEKIFDRYCKYTQ